MEVLPELQDSKKMNERVWIRGANWHDDDGYVMAAQWPLVSLRLDDKGGSLRCSLPGLLGRAFELGIFGFGAVVFFLTLYLQYVLGYRVSERGRKLCRPTFS